MLRIDKVQTINGLTVYGDDRNLAMFYMVPDTPRFRTDENGSPVFKFLKYRLPVDRPDGKKGGGYCFFDVEFTVSEEKINQVKEELQEQVNRRFSGREAPKVKIGTISYVKGEASLLLSADNGVLIEKVNNPGKPSMFGKNITPFSVELTPEGAALFWEALQGKGGIIQVVYDLHMMATLPPVKIRGNFNATKFYSFSQTVDYDWHLWSEDSYQETIREQFRESQAISVNIDWGALTDEKLRRELRDWAFRTTEDHAEKMMIESIVPVSEEGRQVPDGIENVTRDISTTKVASFSLRFKESQPVEWFIGPRGTLPNITSMTDNDGNPIKWEDHAKEIDTDDKFFKELHVDVYMNANFKELPINSAEVHIEYEEGATHEIKEFRFGSADEIGRFATYVENNNWNYKYWYQVNYKDEDKAFKTEPVVSNEQVLTINVGRLGILNIDVAAGDLNFSQVREAQVTVQYEDSSRGVDPIEWQFTFNKDHTQERLQKVIFAPQNRPYRYKVKYFMQDGREYARDWNEARANRLFINDPFSALKTVGLRAVGDLKEKIDTIFVDLKYIDKENDYTQTLSRALNRDTPFLDWSFPVIDEMAGVIRYSSTIKYKDGTSETIDEAETQEMTLLFGDIISDFLEVKVLPNLIKFTEVALVQLQLRYDDDANDIHEGTDFIFTPEEKMPKIWKVAIEDKSKKTYTWAATFFMVDGSERSIDKQESTAMSIVLKTPKETAPA